MDVIFGEPVSATDFEKIPGVLNVHEANYGMRITVRGEIDALVKAVASHRVEDLTFTQPSLESFFLSFYGQEAAGMMAEPAIGTPAASTPENEGEGDSR
jgi:hypothetical protein